MIKVDVRAMLGFVSDLIDSGRFKKSGTGTLFDARDVQQTKKCRPCVFYGSSRFVSHEWFVTNKIMKSLLNSDLKDAYVWPARFVKRFSHLTRKMLKQLFIRSAALYCAENQQVTSTGY